MEWFTGVYASIIVLEELIGGDMLLFGDEMWMKSTSSVWSLNFVNKRHCR